VADVLPVALGHLDDFWTDFDELPATLLRCSAAALANRERDWVARAAWVVGTLKNLTAEEQDGCVVIERRARVAADFRHRFAKCGEHLVGCLSLRFLSNTQIFGLAGARLMSFCATKRRRSRPSTESAFLLDVNATKRHSRRQCHRSPLAPMEIGQEEAQL